MEGFGLEAVYDYLPQGRQVETVSIHRGESTPLATTLTWDNLNRLKASLGEPSASTPQSHTYHYDQRSRRIKRQQGDGYWDYGYDSLNQLASAVKRNDTDAILPGYQWDYTFETIGNPVETGDSGQNTGYTVNALNQITERNIPRTMRFRGLAHPAAVLTLSEDDPVSGTVTNVNRLTGDPRWLAEAGYENVSGSSDRRHAQFTLEGILAGAGHNNTDAIAEDYVSGLLGPDPETFTHDADGNLTQDAFWNYEWDAENRLRSIEHRSDLQSFFDTNDLVRKRLEFVYDSQSRRIQKDVYTWDAAANDWTLVESRRWLYDHWNPMVECVSTNGTDYTLARTYLWGLDLAEQSGNHQAGRPVGSQSGGVGGLLAIRIAGSNEVLLPTYDGHGNVMALVDADNGTVIAEYEYGPFGELLRSTGPMAIASPFGLSTKYTDSETGLVYYGYRFYNPDTGRFLNHDPIEEAGGLNLYGFVGNDPVNHWDYLGLWVVTREGESLAKAVSSAGDTIESLAKEIGLSADEFEKWLTVLEGSPTPSSATENLPGNCKYKIPNTGYIDIGSYSWGVLNLALRSYRGGLEGRWRSEGLRVIVDSNASVGSILTNLGRDDVYRYAYIGHGGHGILTGIDDDRETLENWEAEGCIMPGVYTKFGINEMHLFACGTGGREVTWARNVSKNGYLRVLAEDPFRVYHIYKEGAIKDVPGSR